MNFLFKNKYLYFNLNKFIMKKTIYLLFALVMAISLNSCGGSDDSPSGSSSSDKIVGNWKYIGDIDEDVFDANTDESCDDDFIKFNSNGTALSTDKSCEDITETSSVTWENTGSNGVYIFVETETGETSSASVVFSEDFKEMSLYPEGDFTYGVVFRKQ